MTIPAKPDQPSGLMANTAASGDRKDPPASKPAFESVADGIIRISLPFRFPPGHVNAWLVDDGDGWLVIDTGWGDEETRQVWYDVERLYFDGKLPKHLLLTHFHPDHSGLAHWLCERWQIGLSMTRTEWLQSRMVAGESPSNIIQLQAAFLREAGVAAADVNAVVDSLQSRPAFHRLPAPYHRLQGGQTLKVGATSWQVMIGRGHTPEMACLYDTERQILISADQILTRITPHIGLSFIELDSDPLGEFLQSFGIFESLPEATLVLPSHGDPFRGLHDNIAYTRQHHAERLERVLKRCEAPASIADVTEILFKPQPPGRLFFAVAEAAAHVRHLEVLGRLLKIERGDGVALYQSRG